VQQNVKRGMTFAAALRSFLRQDPDIIMVGEIRDLETAEIAVKAAQTGHMVLSTLHTNDAPQTIARLMNMGIAPYNITSSVTLVIAQRLAGACTTASAKRTCPNTRCWPRASPRTRSTPGSPSTRRWAARTAPKATRAVPASIRSCR
jgi:type IV pilus assembly protein PilB